MSFYKDALLHKLQDENDKLKQKKKMNQISNSTKIEMLCELAHNRVEDADTSYIIENKGDGQYTEDGQDLFNDWYDYYDTIILGYLKEIK